MAKRKFYAIRQIDGETVDLLLTDWNKVKSLVLGHRAEFKSFTTIEEANNYLDYEEETQEEEILNKKDFPVYYVDGSYLNEKIGWGFVLVINNQIINKHCGYIPNGRFTSANVTGELEAAKQALTHAVANGYKKIAICNDYQGVSSYVTGAWEAKKVDSKNYTNFMKRVMNKYNVEINFIKVKGHSGNIYNDAVDEMAKLGSEFGER